MATPDGRNVAGAPDPPLLPEPDEFDEPEEELDVELQMRTGGIEKWMGACESKRNRGNDRRGKEERQRRGKKNG
jgi:hypothetical protein